MPVCRVTGRSGSAGPCEIRFQPVVQLRDSAAGDLPAALESSGAERFVRARHAGDRHVGSELEAYRFVASGARRQSRAKVVIPTRDLESWVLAGNRLPVV